MWEMIINEGTDLRWVVSAIESGSALWVSDGSHMKEVNPHISGVGWLLHCRTTGLRL